MMLKIQALNVDVKHSRLNLLLSMVKMTRGNKSGIKGSERIITIQFTYMFA